MYDTVTVVTDSYESPCGYCGLEPRFYRTTASALNHKAISPAPDFYCLGCELSASNEPCLKKLSIKRNTCVDTYTPILISMSLMNATMSRLEDSLQRCSCPSTKGVLGIKRVLRPDNIYVHRGAVFTVHTLCHWLLFCFHVCLYHHLGTGPQISGWWK